MPLHRLENFIKNIEGRILYVNPNDLDSTDSISNDGNSLAQPFKTIQRALIEAARFSYVGGDNNDYIERTTILIYPGEHTIDNRPGYGIRDAGTNTATAVAPNGDTSGAGEAQTEFGLTLTSNFDLTQEDNILYKFNSVNGGVVVPRGTSIVGLDLRKTKIRPKYVPNPLASEKAAPRSAIFRVTGACYFWQFSIFDGSGSVYTNRTDFNDVAAPTFSHHKLTCFEYADGVNTQEGYDSTDLDMYYYKLSNAFNAQAPDKSIPASDKYPRSKSGFAPMRPEFEIVGAFLNDPVKISDFICGDGTTLSNVCTVTTNIDHKLNLGTPIRIKGIVSGTKGDEIAYNTTAIVTAVLNSTQFTYVITGDRTGLLGSVANGLNVANATVTVETDNVDGASPYIFNCSLRSVYGMNGMWADGSKATGFRSLVVAQFTGISLQKDDRAFVKYDKETREYNGLPIETPLTQDILSSGSSAAATSDVYHLDSDAIYRSGWETCHIRMSDNAIMQIVSVFAIGYNRHFSTESGGDASITNANSNFGQISLNSDGFRREAFAKDNTSYITNIITPKSISIVETEVDWFKVDNVKTKIVGVSSHLYLEGFTNQSDVPPTLVGGYRVGAKVDDILYVPIGAWKERKDLADQGVKQAAIQMVDGLKQEFVRDGVSIGNTVSYGTNSSVKTYKVTSGPTNNVLTIGTHALQNGESIRIFSDSADLPENISPHQLYYAITSTKDITLTTSQIKLASSFTDAQNNEEITIYKGSKLSIESRVHDKESGDLGSPIQWDEDNKQWYIHVNNTDSSVTTTNPIFDAIAAAGDSSKILLPDEYNASYIKRNQDSRSLDDKIYKLRVVVPKEVQDGKNPEESFIIQESSSTGARSNNDFSLTGIGTDDFAYKRNPRFIGTCSVVGSELVTVVTDLPHNLKLNEEVVIKNVKSTTNTTGIGNSGYNGIFAVTDIPDTKSFKYKTTDIKGNFHNVGTFSNDVTVRNTDLPRFERSDLLSNYYVYRNETISPYIENQQDGIYHLFVLNASNQVSNQFTDLNYSQNVVDLYPQLDRDNNTDNPSASTSKAVNSPLGDVVTNYLKDSLTRETLDKFVKDFTVTPTISGVSDSGTSATLTFTKETYHNYSGIATGSISVAGASYSNGTYHNVKLLGTSSDPTPGTSIWLGATATVVVTGGAVSSVSITDSGGGYSAASLFFDRTAIGSGDGTARYSVTADGISSNVGDTVQVTGIGTEPDGYYRITSIPNNTQIAIAKTAGDHTPIIGQYVYNTGPSVVAVSDAPDYNSTTGITQFTTSPNTGIGQTVAPHGLSAGSKFRVVDKTNNNNLGDFTVDKLGSVADATDPTGFSAKTVVQLGTTDPYQVYILRHGMSANDANSDNVSESLGARGTVIYDNESLILKNDNQNIAGGKKGLDGSYQIRVELPSATGIGTVSIFPLGSYIQIGDEIMRITTNSLSGSANDEMSVIRGALGSKKRQHRTNSLIRKIKPLAIEFHRPSIARASGHTFEYVGFGPGNYSTGLPQVQVKSLTEREEFLSQSQERSGGTVMYTGMNNRGDFFIGNKKINSATGQERTFDAPIPTTTGEDPARLSVIFDEVICKERILVEGGTSKRILSQFDGPVQIASLKVTGESIFDGAVTFNGKVNFAGNDDIAKIQGALVIDDIKLQDEVNLWIGDGSNSASNTVGDVQIYHEPDDNNTYVNHLSSTPGHIQFKHSGTDRLQVNSSGLVLSGVTTTGILTANNRITGKDGIYIPDSKYLSFGNFDNDGSSYNPDFQIHHRPTDGTTIFESRNASGHLYLMSKNRVEITDESSANVGFRFNNSGTNNEVELFYNSSSYPTAKLKTIAEGVQINGELRVTDDITAFYATSDKNLKDNITPIENPLAKVISISGNTFTWKEGNSNQGEDTGVVAQEIEALGLPGIVKDQESGHKSVQYHKLIPLLIEAIKELKSEVDELKKGK